MRGLLEQLGKGLECATTNEVFSDSVDRGAGVFIS